MPGGRSQVLNIWSPLPNERFDSTKVLVADGSHRCYRAVNKAHLDHYVAKPWDPDELWNTVTDLLTDYVLENDINPLSVYAVLG